MLRLTCLVVLLCAFAYGARFPLLKRGVPGFPSSRIVGGQDATPGEFPHQISLQLNQGGSASHICGGSILNENWVITAGHCLLVAEPGPYVFYEVVAGEFNLAESEGPEQRIRMAERFIHEDYPGGTAQNDIALIKLEAPLTLNDVVQAIALPEAGQVFSGDCIASGWGSISQTLVPIYPDTLMKVTLPVLSYEECLAIWESKADYGDSQICAGPVSGGEGICYGDSGGPLTCEAGGKKYVAGLSSFVLQPCGREGYPPVFTRVASFVDWVNDKISSN